jgi:hypothetical protein
MTHAHETTHKRNDANLFYIHIYSVTAGNAANHAASLARPIENVIQMRARLKFWCTGRCTADYFPTKK